MTVDTEQVTSAGVIAGLEWSAATRPGRHGKPNQDRYVITQTDDGLFAAVIDGATSISDARPDGADYAETLARHLQSRTAGRHVPDLSQLLAGGIADTREDLSLPGPTHPSATVALIHIMAAVVDLAVLGDCTVLSIRRDGGVLTLSDDRLQQIAPDLRREYRARLSHGSGFDAGHVDLLEQIRHVEERTRNTQGGYPIAADDPTAATQAVSRQMLRHEIAWLLLATDGATLGPTRYGTPPDWHATTQLDPADVLDQVHATEDTDPHAQRWPRSKPHDDKTLCRIRL